MSKLMIAAVVVSISAFAATLALAQPTGSPPNGRSPGAAGPRPGMPAGTNMPILTGPPAGMTRPAGSPSPGSMGRGWTPPSGAQPPAGPMSPPAGLPPQGRGPR